MRENWEQGGMENTCKRLKICAVFCSDEFPKSLQALGAGQNAHLSNQVENRLIGFTSKFRFILVQQYGAVQYYRVTLADDLGTYKLIQPKFRSRQQ